MLGAVALVTVASALHPAPGRAIDSAAGGIPDSVVVSDNPVDWTPHVLDGRVTALTQVGDRIVVGGQFGKVRQAGSGEVLQRRNLFAFDARTGVIDRTFNPGPDDQVSALVAAPGADAVFVGGRFTHIAGQAKTALAKLDVPSGRPSAGFGAWVSRRVDDLALHGSRLFVAGVINSVNGVARSGLGAVDPVTGALDAGVDVSFTDPRNTLLAVNRLAVRPDGSRLVALGSFLKADGQDRPQLAVLDLDDNGAHLADWHTDGYAARCDEKFETYMRGVDVSADGSFMVVVTTGSRARPLCDAVARFELGGTGKNIQPTWIDYSGGDSFMGVAVTDGAIYVGGHQRWMNNPFNNDTGLTATPGVGSVPRPGISALDPVNGLPLSWNPGRNPRGLGVFMFLATPQGLWIGSDTDFIAGEKRPRLALLPTAGGKVIADPAPADLPTVLYHRESGELVAQRLDAAGDLSPTVALGGGVDWSQARAAFTADGRRYTAWADNRIDVRPLSGDAVTPVTESAVPARLSRSTPAAPPRPSTSAAPARLSPSTSGMPPWPRTSSWLTPARPDLSTWAGWPNSRRRTSPSPN